MTAYVLRRLFYALLTFFGITVATFALIHSVPGDPIAFYAGRAGVMNLPPAAVQALRAEYHLDEPLPQQYLYWLRAAVTFDFGASVIDRRPVRERVAEKLPNTLLLNGTAFFIAALIGLPAGMWSAVRAGRKAERTTAMGFFLLYSLPSFWVALMLMQVFAVRYDVLPLLGMSSDRYFELGTFERIVDRLRHMVLPVVTVAYTQVAIFARFSRSALAEVIRQDFITTARAKGAGPGAVIWRHALRNALVPLITLLGVTVPYLFSGSVIVEQIFQWDGIGLLYYDAILARDYPTVMALTVVTAVVTLMATFVADLLYALADPRVRLEAGR